MAGATRICGKRVRFFCLISPCETFFLQAEDGIRGGRVTGVQTCALPISKQTISQPYIVARMIELLDLTGKEKVLEIGTGTGYQTVVLSKLCAKVFSIERINELALRAVELIRTLKIYNATV